MATPNSHPPRDNDARYKKDLTHFISEAETISSIVKLNIWELLFTISFVANLVIGKLLHTVAVDSEVHNYFNDKNNVINQLVVKRGWGWTTVVIFAFYGLLLAGPAAKHHHHYNNQRNQPITIGRTLTRAGINYIVSTIWWIFFTQWFFGSPIMDRIFVWTGGKCTDLAQDLILNHRLYKQSPNIFRQIDLQFETAAVTSYTCRKLHGNWSGGHDPSGHVFLMVHSSLYIIFDTLPFYSSILEVMRGLTRTWDQAKRARAWTKVTVFGGFLMEYPQVFVWMLASLWWWMLLMTSIYFHSVLEKLVGLAFGFLTFGVLYYGPRFYSEALKVKAERYKERTE